MSVATLRELRTEKGLTQLEVARFIGTSKSYYCMMESGSRKVPLDKAFKLAQLFGREVGSIDFFCHEGSPNANRSRVTP